MKKVKMSLNIILFVMFINIFGISSVNATTNPYNQQGPYGTNCTWYAWKVVNEKTGIALPGWGNAKNWYNDAKNAGYTVGTEPKANSIIVWGGWTSYGHVGYVESVGDNTLYVWDSSRSCVDQEEEEFRECIANSVSEQTDKVCYANAKKIACEFPISPDYYGLTGFIYLDYEPKKPTPSVSQNNNSNKDTSANVVKKSSNANLSDIVFSNGTIEFDKGVLEYNIEVENEVDIITISATLEDEKATIKGTGDYELNVGLNEIKLTVTAEDGTKKEYIMQVTRNEKIEPEIEPDNNETEDVTTEDDEQIEEAIPKNDSLPMIILSVCIVILFIVCLVFILKKNKSHNKTRI